MKDFIGEHSICGLITPFASVIETNYIPCRDDIIHLEALLAEPQIQLSQLDSEISRLQDKLDSVILQRESLKKYIDAHRALMSPMRRLPPETLSEIFTHCLPEPYAVRDTSEAPLLLTAVSRQWRHTAIGTPALWKSLHIYLPRGMSFLNIERRIVGSSLWLKRSGSLPLSISLSMDTSLLRRPIIPDPDLDPMHGIYTKFIEQILLKNSNRIHHLSFVGSQISDMVAHLDLLASHTLPILTVFRVCYTGMSRYRAAEEPSLPFTSLVQQMPALRNLAIVGFSHTGQKYIQLKIHWDHLTELVLQPSPIRRSISARFSSAEVLNMLGRAPRLESLTISIDISTWTSDTTVLNLPSMREMRLVFFNLGQHDISIARTYLHNFYRSISCPGLKTLYASWRGIYMKDMPFSGFSSLAELEILSLDMPLTPTTLIDSLTSMPKLRTLDITNKAMKIDDGDLERDILPSLVHTVDDSVLTYLTDNGESTPCPDLQHIRIIYKDNLSSSITYPTLLMFLESRVKTSTSPSSSSRSSSRSNTSSSSSLKSCDIFFTHPRATSTDDEVHRFRELVNSGLDLRIRYGRFSPEHTSSIDSPKAGLLVVNPPDPDREGPYGTGVIV